MKTTNLLITKKHFILGCLFTVLFGFSQPFTSPNLTICGENNVLPINTEGYTNFNLSSKVAISIFIDSDCKIKYSNQPTSNLFLKLDSNQLDTSLFTVTVSANSSNGMLTIQEIFVTNNTKVWTGSTSLDWSDANNWIPKGVPTESNCVIISSKTILSGTNYNAYAKSINVKPTGNCEIQTSNNLTVVDGITIDAAGVFNVKNNAALFQVNEVPNTGIINIEKTTQPMSYYDYTYWNSPVTADSNFTFANLSPQTKSDIWSFKTTVSGGCGNWVNESTSSIMIPNKGYIVKAPDTFSTNSNVKTTYTTNFVGTPNNGTILTPISKGTNANLGGTIKDEDDEWNLIGNPYPSGIDAKKLLEHPENTNIIEGTIYIWTKNMQPSAAYKDTFYGDFVLNYTINDYASFNKTGSTSTSSSAATGCSVPSGYIASGNAFFVKAAKSLANGTTANVIFNNSMRTTESNIEISNNSSDAKKTTLEEKHRVWLNLTNNSGAFSQTLIGYITGATQELDRGYDGESFGGNDVTFYSIIPQAKLAIQGRALPFDQNDEVTLGYKATKKGNYSIRIDRLDGMLENQSIILVDKELNTVQDLKVSPYVFYSKVGEFNSRFVIRYENKTLATEKNYLADNAITLFYENNNNTLNIINSIAVAPIQKVSLYNILGQAVNNLNFDENQDQLNIQFPLNSLNSGVYIAKVETSNGEVTKKIIIP